MEHMTDSLNVFCCQTRRTKQCDIVAQYCALDDALDEVMPVSQVRVAAAEARCDWGCEQPTLSAAEQVGGYCSGRRCKAKMHHLGCVVRACEARVALGCDTRFCQG